jgi:Phytanoyl-CoA dioxygenase (PhyH)
MKTRMLSMTFKLRRKFRSLQGIMSEWKGFAKDYLLSLLSDQNTSSSDSYNRLRWLYSLSKGKSNSILALPYQVRHPYFCQAPKHLRGTCRSIVKNGFSRIEPTREASNLAKRLNHELQECALISDLSFSDHPKRYLNLSEASKDEGRQAARLRHSTEDVLNSEAAWELIDLLNMYDIACSYLRCTPVLTSMISWHVFTISETDSSEEIYDVAAQTYHYDLDYIRFVKFFVNLTDVNETDGPFEYVPLSHHHKPDEYFRDGRFAERNLSLAAVCVKADGPAGSMFIADTSGLHRDGRACGGYRHVLQVEFACSLFGAKFQYIDPLTNKFPHFDRSVLPPSLAEKPKRWLSHFADLKAGYKS